MLRQNDLGAGKRVEPSPEMFGDLFDRAFAFDGSGKNRSHHRQYVAHAVLQFADQSLQPRLAFAQAVLGLIAGLDVHAHARPVADASLLGAERPDVQAAPSIPPPPHLAPPRAVS